MCFYFLHPPIDVFFCFHALGVKIGLAGARAIADALKVNSTLRVFSLRGHWTGAVIPSIGDEEATLLAEALTVNNSIQELDLRGMLCVCSFFLLSNIAIHQTTA